MNTLDPAQAEELERKLTRVYVALAMTRNVAEEGVNREPGDEASRSMLTLLNVASEMLEEILDQRLLNQAMQTTEVPEVEIVM
jgi:hypothetical protein